MAFKYIYLKMDNELCCIISKMVLNISIYQKKKVNDSNLGIDSMETRQEGAFTGNKISVLCC